jgi:dihydropteroate synthase
MYLRDMNFQLPKIMGILNLTMDSFSDGGHWIEPANAVQHALSMLKDGADIIDLGAESTRPGAAEISEHEEWQRIEPVLNMLKEQNPDCRISIDTQKSYVAQRAIACGVDMINDISALEYDPEMAPLLKDQPGVEVVLMHMQGRPQTMQHNPQYEDVVCDVKQYLLSRLQYAEAQGIALNRVYLDPGIGFGKNLEHNLAILANLDVYKGFKLLLGASRKSFINKLVPSEPGQRLGGSLAAAMWCVFGKAAIIRVHDVREHYQFMQVMAATNQLRRED